MRARAKLEKLRVVDPSQLRTGLQTAQGNAPMAPDRIRLLFSGDLALGGEFARHRKAEKLTWEYPFQSVRPVFRGADVRVGNLECALFDGSSSSTKDWRLCSAPDSVAALKYLDYSVLSIGNNHITDCGPEGVAKTIDVLASHGVAVVGAGLTEAQATRPAAVRVRGQRLTFFSYANPDGHSVIATPSGAGCAPLELDTICHDIAQSRASSDVICISLHWGREYFRYPDPWQITVARRLIDAGAHIIAGHHPHVVQGVERYKHGVIFYSLGNFFLPDFRLQSGMLHTHPKVCKTTILGLCTVQGGIVRSVEIVPCLQYRNRRLAVLRGRRQRRAVASFNALSRNLGSSHYRRFWNAYSRGATQLADRVILRDKLAHELEIARRMGVSAGLRYLLLSKVTKIGRLLYWYLFLGAIGTIRGFMHRAGVGSITDKLRHFARNPRVRSRRSS